ncbi:MAG: iron-containing redox enzyme family protein [Planctomycetota bacterium]|nr:iron-containing redox enzyme family protein [Planctomycetota bacterium]
MASETATHQPEPSPAADHAPRHEILPWLQNRIESLLVRVQAEEFWRVLMDPGTSPALVQAIMREIYLEIAGYQPHVIEAAIASIGQMPRAMDARMVRSMLLHQSEEFDHGEMAIRDFVGLGGSAELARTQRMSPPSFAVAGMWWMIAHQRDPFAYVGALYLFEGLTPTVTGLVKARLREKGFKKDSLEYVEFHSTEDIKHANLVNHLITEAARVFPEALESIKHGYDCFEAVYPIPVWRCAYERAVASVSPGRQA